MGSATTLSTRAPIDRIPGEGAGGRPRILRVAVVWTLIVLVAFLLLQAILAAYNVSEVRAAIGRGEWEASPYDRLTVLSRLFPIGIAGTIAFVSISVCGSVIASRGHRVLFALPGIAFVFASVLVAPHHPEPIGVQWGLACFDWDIAYTTCAMPWFGNLWLGPTVDLGMALIPGFVVARRVRPRRWPGRVDTATAASVLTAGAAVATTGWAIAVIQNRIDVRPVAAVGLLGLVLGAARPWWPWLHVIVAVALANGFAWLLDMVFWPDPGYPLSAALPHILGDTWPIVAIGLVASASQPLAWLIRRLQDRPLRLVIAVNALNAADAVLTFLAVRSGGAYEANPFVRAVGLPMKIAFVGALTWLLFKRKPSALVWPFAVLVWVLGYHVAGVFVNGWR